MIRLYAIILIVAVLGGVCRKYYYDTTRQQSHSCENLSIELRMRTNIDKMAEDAVRLNALMINRRFKRTVRDELRVH